MNPSPDQEFDFSKYRIKDSVADSGMIEAKPSIDEPFDFSKYQIKEEPSQLKELGRHAIRTGSRALETVAGLPGDLVNFVKYLDESLPQVPKFLNPDPNILQQAGQKALEKVPTSSDLKQISSSLTGGYTDPTTKAEEIGDEITSLATALINPSKAMSGLGSLARNLGSSVLKSSIVKGSGVGAEALGADESTKNKVELGTLMLTGLMNAKSADKYVAQKYEKARSLIPKGTIVETKKLADSLDQVDKVLSKGISTQTKDSVKSALNELKSKAKTGTMELDEIVQSFHDINERISSKQLFEELNTSQRKLLKSRYDLLKGEIGKEIKGYGNYNPEFYKEWSGANEGYKTIADSKRVSNFISSKIGSIPKHLVGSIALDLFLGSPKAVTTTLGGYGTLKSAELLYRIGKSPTLRDHYRKVIMEAGNENFKGMINNLEKLENEAKKIQD